MNMFGNWLAGVCLAAALVSGSVMAQDKTTLVTDKDKTSYAIGMSLPSVVTPAAMNYLDPQALHSAVERAVAGQPPALPKEEAAAIGQALALALKQGNASQGSSAPAPASTINKVKASQLVGGYIMGPVLLGMKDDIELPVVLQGMDAALGKGHKLLSDEQVQVITRSFVSQHQAAVAQHNREASAAFLAKNKTNKGVVTTASGLQYMVLHQGNGKRPSAASTVKVNYEGKRLDGTVFDSSYRRGEPASFPLAGVIPGWTEGLQLMPVGSKYRFWIPSPLAYGPKGQMQAGIGPDMMLMFDVELISIVE